ncbi:disease resistance protein RFL1-like [Magnolia sinica]|uniref:disease resistance protein RFL1-like n=1 Tax=Magnolia sinica TaxID=86752 RepID=UPI0026593A45|nr:disease resistance protein RFL1-like [Magnolia sinica]
MEFIGMLFEVVKNVWEPFAEQLKYLKSLPENMEILRSKTEELSSQQNDVKMELDRAEVRQGKKRKRDVEVWLKNVETITKDVRNIEDKLGEEERYLPRLRLGKLVVKKIEEVTELQQKGRFSDGLLMDAMPENGITLPTTRLVGKTTTERTLEMVWDCLMDVSLGKIGVHGMGGVGKTTIMKHINNRLRETHFFDDIIWVTVSKARSLVRLQSDIAKAIELDLPEDDYEDNRSAKLFAALMRRKKFVLILDDMWEAFPLEKVGIPAPDEDNGCKLVLTTRDLGVCRGMETEKEIKVEVLLEEEAWELFKDKVGGEEVLSTNISNVAMLVAKECGRLPLAIVTVGRALRQVDDVRVWRNALNELKGSTCEIKGMEDVVFARLRFSYHRLRNDQIRACFLFCALYPEDYEIPTWELKDYWIWEGLIAEVGNREAELDKGQAILKELQYACMLESVIDKDNVECVKMHDLIRDMAINIARVASQFMVKAGVGLKELPRDEEWDGDLERVSLMRNDIEGMTGRPKCPKLCTLLLQLNPLSENPTHSFFEHMHSLKVLDLSLSNLKFLPESLSELENLHALLLRRCPVSKVPSLAKMKELRVLNLYHTRIEELPEGVENLTTLRQLDLSCTRNFKIFPAEVIPKLAHLEDLLIYRSSCRWSSCSSLVGEGAGIEEIMRSPQITTLYIHFVDLPTFVSYMRSRQWRMLKGFRFTIGLVSSHLPSAAFEWHSFSVEIVGCNLVSGENSLLLPDNTLNLDIDDCNDISRLSELPCLANLTQLRECYLGQCKGMECVIMAEENSLSTLEKLLLSELPNLRTLCNGFVLHDTLVNLKVLHVEACLNLKNLFSLFLLHQLQNLEEIVVEGCKVMEEIASGGGEVGETINNTITLPRLKRLEFYRLPELKSICGRILICNSLCIIKVWNCPKLKKLPISLSSLTHSLKEIRGSRKWWNELEWDNHNAKTHLQPFFKDM